MSPSDKITYELSIKGVLPGFNVTISNGDEEFHSLEGRSHYQVSLPKGVYTITTEREGRIVEEIIRHANHQTIKLKIPNGISSQPIPGLKAENISLDFTELAWSMSKRILNGDIGAHQNQEASLLFVATNLKPGNLQKTEQVWNNWCIKDLSGQEQVYLSKDSDAVHHKDGVIYSSLCKEGTYLLHTEEKEGKFKNLPIHLFKGFQTQIFVGFDNGLRLESVRILMVNLEELNYLDSNPFAEGDNRFELPLIDAALWRIQRHSDVFSTEITNSYLNAKFSNPILGLLGAYMMLNRWHRTKARLSSENIAFIKMVVNNLEGLLPNCADILALKISVNSMVDNSTEPGVFEISSGSVENLPIFRMGSEIILRAAADDETWLAENSLLESIADKLDNYSPWTSWEDSGQANLENDKVKKINPDWLELAIADILESKNFNLTMSSFAKRLNVTPRKLRKETLNLAKRIVSEPKVMGELGYNSNLIQKNLFEKLVPGDIELLTWILIGSNHNLSYQWLYPKLKNALGVLARKTGPINASDAILDLIGDKQMESLFDGMLQHLSTQISENSEQKLKDEMAKSLTVRDIARVLINKS